MTTLGKFYDPRLVAVYDTLNPIAEYEGFYVDLASKLSALSVVDVGCGMGCWPASLPGAVIAPSASHRDAMVASRCGG